MALYLHGCVCVCVHIYTYIFMCRCMCVCKSKVMLIVFIGTQTGHETEQLSYWKRLPMGQMTWSCFPL